MTSCINVIKIQTDYAIIAFELMSLSTTLYLKTFLNRRCWKVPVSLLRIIPSKQRPFNLAKMPQQILTCSKSTIETLEKGMKYVQRWQWKYQDQVTDTVLKPPFLMSLLLTLNRQMFAGATLVLQSSSTHWKGLEASGWWK